ncbi:MAG: 50S ribosome-binding GTPase [Nanoarchaeota archaeon]|nr:50S ribosome-binding GTPase [Nanoarchaeota archaeon]
MNFQNIRPVGKPDDFFDAAFSRAKKRAAQLRSKGKKLSSGQEKKIEYVRMDIIKDVLESKLIDILKDFPDIDSLNEFYQELIRTTLNYVDLKKSLGAINTSVRFVKKFHRDYIMKFKRANNQKQYDKLRREFYGKMSSVVKRIKNELKYLEECRRVMRTYPDVKDMKTIAITGFPNVGKSTLLNKLSKAKGEVAVYAFTTKGLNLGYMKIDSRKIQLVDTPGTLDRLEKMNDIERQAYLAIKYLADLVIYVFDLSEPFPLKDQIKLYKRLKDENKKVLVYFSKADVLDLDMDLVKKYKGVVWADDLKKKIKRIL